MNFQNRGILESSVEIKQTMKWWWVDHFYVHFMNTWIDRCRQSISIGNYSLLDMYSSIDGKGKGKTLKDTWRHLKTNNVNITIFWLTTDVKEANWSKIGTFTSRHLYIRSTSYLDWILLHFTNELAILEFWRPGLSNVLAPMVDRWNTKNHEMI